MTAEIDAAWGRQRQDLLLAEAAFRARPSTIDQQLRAALHLAELVRTAEDDLESTHRWASERSALSALRAFSRVLEQWRLGGERASSNECPWEEPVTETKLLALLEIPSPDRAIAVEITRCGVSFRPDGTLLPLLARNGIGSASRSALRAQDVFRLSRQQVPSLESTLSTALVPSTAPAAPKSDIDTRAAQAVGGWRSNSGPDDSLTQAPPPTPRERNTLTQRHSPRDRYRRGSPVRLRLQVTPTDASVYLDGRFVGTGGELARLRSGLIVDAGVHHLEVVRPDYGAEQTTVELQEGEEVTIRVELNRD